MKTCVFKHKDMFPLYPVSIGNRHLQEKVVRPDGLVFDQIFAVCGGEGVFEADGKAYELEKGDMFFAPKGVPHSYYGNDSFTTAFLGFNGDYVEKLYSYFGVDGSGVYKGKDSRAFLALIDGFYGEFGSTTDSAMLCAKTYEIAAVFFRTALQTERSDIYKVKEYLEANYFLPVTLSDILEFYPYSKSKLCRDFYAAFGKTVFEKLTEIRLEHSRIMLYDPSVKLSAVAQSCGFNDVSYFCRTYKRFYGKSPRCGA